MVSAAAHICHNYCLASIYKLHNQNPPPGRSVARRAAASRAMLSFITGTVWVLMGGKCKCVSPPPHHATSRDTNYGGSQSCYLHSPATTSHCLLWGQYIITEHLVFKTGIIATPPTSIIMLSGELSNTASSLPDWLFCRQIWSRYRSFCNFVDEMVELLSVW